MILCQQLQSTKAPQCVNKIHSNRSLLQRAISMASRELSARLLRRGLTMYPAALKWRSMAAEVAGILWCSKWSSYKCGYFKLLLCQKSRILDAVLSAKYNSNSCWPPIGSSTGASFRKLNKSSLSVSDAVDCAGATSGRKLSCTGFNNSYVHSFNISIEAL